MFYLTVDDYTLAFIPDLEIITKISYNAKPFVILPKNKKFYLTQGSDNYIPVKYSQ